MKRDLDLIKKILESIEERTDTSPSEIEIPGYRQDDIDYNARLLVDAGYIDAQVLGYGGVYARRLTYYGHEFLDSTKDKGIWEKAKGQIVKNGGAYTMEIIKALLSDMLKKKLGI